MKNMKLVSRILIFSCGFYFACEKNSINLADNDKQESRVVLAGIYDSANFHLKLNPSIKIDEYEIGCLSYSGTESLDIYKDGYPELIFNSKSLLPDISGECCDCPDDPEISCDCWPSGRVYKYIETIDTMYQIACDLDNRAISFEINDTIENCTQWITGSWITLIDIYNFPPPETIYGNWVSVDDRYLGVRKIEADTLYGWIRINLSETIEIKEMYFEK